jgi:hypothetical protein
MIFRCEDGNVAVTRCDVDPHILDRHIMLRIEDDERGFSIALTPDEAEAIGRELCDLAGASREWLCSLGLLVLGLVTGVAVGWAVWG